MTTPFTCLATLSSILLTGGCVDFTDEEGSSQNLSTFDTNNGTDSGFRDDDNPKDTADESGGEDTSEPKEEEPQNRLVNPGFESGESWNRASGGYVNQKWATTGDGIYQSSATFTAIEGDHSLKIWGFYKGDMPAVSETALTLGELTAGDDHVFSLQAYTHMDDAPTEGNSAVLFLRYHDSSGAPLSETVGDIQIDHTTDTNTWHSMRVSASVPTNASYGVVGIRYTLASWESGGSIYIDDASWTSTGSGAVLNERLLVWQEEFNGSALDGDTWNTELLDAYTYNNELQAYTDREENLRIEDGQLILTARHENYGSAQYTSARINTSGKAGWTHGRFEGMLQVPAGQGTWPAFWMLPTEWSFGSWPDSGEIDIMEHVGCDPNVVHGTVHTGAYNHMLDTQQGGSMELWSATTTSHLYAIDWTTERIVFSVDGNPYFTFSNDGAGNSDTWPFDEVFHFVINLAVGGDWGGYCGVDASVFPQEYRIDWVRVYQ